MNNIHKQFFQAINTELGSMIFSLICGIGLALVFQYHCKENCHTYFAPHPEDFIDKQFIVEGKCFKYNPYVVECDGDEVLEPYKQSDVLLNKI